MKTLKRILLSGVILVGSVTYAQEAQISAATLPDQPLLTQLPNKEVRAMVCDQDGYLWIGSTRGLFKFSGSCYIPYLRENGNALSSDDITSLCCDSENRIWIGTEYGINMIRDGKPEIVSERNYNLISALTELDRDHLFYSGYNTIGLIDKATGAYTGFKPTSNLSAAVKAVKARDGGVYIIDKNAENVYHLTPELEANSRFSTGSGNPANSIAETENGVYIGTRKGLFLAESTTLTPRPLPKKMESLAEAGILFLETDEKHLYIGVKDRGAIRIDRGTGAMDLISESEHFSDATWSVSLLSDRYLFVSPDGYDLKIIRKSVGRICPVPNTSRKEKIGRLSRTEGDDILAISEDGVLLLDLDARSCTDISPVLPGLTGINIAHFSPDGRFVCFREGALYAFRLKGKRLIPTGKISVPDFRGCWFDRERNTFRVRSGNILEEWDGKAPARSIGEIDLPDFLESFPTRSGVIYFSDYRSSIYRFRNGRMEKLDFQVPFPISIDADRKGGLWIGSGSDGLFRYDLSGGELRHIDLPDENVSQVEVDGNDNVWVCMRSLVLRLDGRDGHSTLYRNPNRESIVYSGTANAKTLDGILYFGGKGFIQEMDPATDWGRESVPVSIVAVTVNGQASLPEKEFEKLSHQENSLAFYYTALCYDAYGALNFAYKLDGYDKEWILTADDNRVRYANLPPGKYTFRIKVQGPDGGWDGEEAVFPLQILPAWWMTAWARILMALLLTALTSFIIYMFVQRRLAQERIRFTEQEKKLSETLNQEKINLFTNLSHELRTPLSLIYGPVRELTRNPALAGPEKEKLSLIESNTHRLLDITEQIIQFNNPLDASSLKISSVDLSEVLRRIACNFSLVAEEARQELSLDIPDTFPAFCDLDKVQKIVFNLLTNALRYTPSGGKITIRLTQVKADHASRMFRLPESLEGNYAEIQVRDTGPGIDPSKMQKIFERYERLDHPGSSRPEEKGFGIGLNYIAWLTGLHKGGIQAFNNPDGGACFSFAIPVSDAAYVGDIVLPSPSSIPSSFSAVPKETPLPENPDGISLLLVEDDESLRSYLQELLSDRFKVVCAQDGDEAARILQFFIPDILVSDIYMPYKDGFTLCSEVKASPELCHIPVILLTALSTYENQVQGLKASADAFVGKPFDPEYLKLVIANLLENRKRLQEALSRPSRKEDQPDMNPLDRTFLKKLYRIVDEHIGEEEFNITAMGQEMGMSRTSFYSKIKALFGDSPQNFLTSYRLEKALELLKTRQYNVSEVAWQVGFSTLSGFSKSFKKKFGIPPSEA